MQLKDEKYKNYEQEDSMEFCRSFLGQMSDELSIGNKVKQKLEYESLNFDNMSLLESYRTFKDNINQRENSIITNIFNVNIINTCECQFCKYKSISYQPELGLILSLKNRNKVIELQEIIEQNFEEEIVDKQCEKCKKGKKAKNSKKICELPEILLLSIQEKIQDTFPITINKELNLEKYISNELIANSNSKYELISIINHQGTHEKAIIIHLLTFRMNGINLVMIKLKNYHPIIISIIMLIFPFTNLKKMMKKIEKYSLKN